MSVLFVFLSLPLLYPTPGETQGNPKEAHGVFTGEMKVVIYVSDVEQSAPFYRDVLGFDFHGFAGEDKNPYYAEMVVAGVKFGLHEPTSDGQETKIGQQRLYIRVEDLHAHRSRVLAWGVAAGEIKKTDWMDLFIVRDADGNEIIFAITDPEHHSIYPWNTGKPVAGEHKKTR
jgi:catechol 2,3-dioxygenase-like lactoylglutathione lyase family enzyme